ncbi:hypothetical protein OFN32_35945, partial [Escherichia coli]|nr:hypothetical protein [Escherichia coli]
MASLNNGQPITSVALGDPATNTTPLDLNGADIAQTLNFGLGSATQFAAPFELTKFDEDGATTGFLTKVDFDENGSVLG